jgi:hypothetical protein
VAASNGTIALFAQRQVYAPSMNFKYQIDQSQPPKEAALLIDDKSFKPTDWLLTLDDHIAALSTTSI